MKDRTKILIILVLTVIMGLWIMTLAGCEEVVRKPEFYSQSLDPNQPYYRYLIIPSEEWKGVLGENERCVILYNLSDLRIGLAKIDQRLKALEPNEVLAQ